MGRYVLVNDIHLSDRPPSSCTDTYLDDLFALLEETVAVAVNQQALAVIWAGDVFHHKTPGQTRHATTRRLIELAFAYPCPVLVVPGNHDMAHDRLDSIDETQPLGVLLASRAAELLLGWSARDAGTIPDFVYGVPWLQRFDDDTVTASLDDWRTHFVGVGTAGPGGAGAHGLVVAHAPLYPLGRELPFENYPAQKWARAMGGMGTCHYGHVHEQHGTFAVGGVRFSNPGALSRGSLHEHNLTRTPAVAVWDADTGELEHVELPARPAAEVFRLTEAAQARTAQLELDRFLTSIGQTRVEITSIEAVLDHVRGLGLEPELVTLIEELLAGAAPAVKG